MAKITYCCGKCGESITEDWNEEIARAELERDFPQDRDAPMKKLVRVCDPCYKEIKEALEIKDGRLH